MECDKMDGEARMFASSNALQMSSPKGQGQIVNIQTFLFLCETWLAW